MGAGRGPDGSVAGRGFNQPILRHDPTAHAEVMALRAAAEASGQLPPARLRVVRDPEPCVMCAGRSCMPASGGWCFGARDPKTGVAGSVLDLFAETRLNHHAEVAGGVLAEACGGLCRPFAARRKRAGA